MNTPSSLPRKNMNNAASSCHPCSSSDPRPNVTNNNNIGSQTINNFSNCEIQSLSVNGAGQSTTDAEKAQCDSEKDASQKDSADDCDADCIKTAASREVHSVSSKNTNGEDSDKVNHGSCSEDTDGNDSNRNTGDPLHIILEEHLDSDSNSCGAKLSVDTSKANSSVAFGSQGNSNNAVPGEHMSTSANNTTGESISDTICKTSVTEQTPKGKQGPSAQEKDESESAIEAEEEDGAVSHETGNVANENTADVTDRTNLARMKTSPPRTSDSPLLVEEGVFARGEDQSVSAEDIGRKEQSECAKILTEILPKVSSQQAVVPQDLKTCTEVVKQDGKVILPDNIFPKTLKELKSKDAQRDIFRLHSFVFSPSSGQEILDEATEETPESIAREQVEAWNQVRSAGEKAFEKCIVENFKNDKTGNIYLGGREPTSMNDVKGILTGLSMTAEAKCDPFLTVCKTIEHIHRIQNEDWVSSLKDIFAEQPVPFSFDEVPDPAKKTKKHTILHIAHLGKVRVIKKVQKLEVNLACMTVRTHRKGDEEDRRKTREWKTIQLSELNLPHKIGMGNTGVLAIESHLYDSWKSAWNQTLGVQDGGGVCDLAKQSEAPRLAFELAKVATRTGWPLEKVIHLLTTSYHEQQCLPATSATIPHCSRGDISLEVQDQHQVVNHRPKLSNPGVSEDKYRGKSVAITPVTQNQSKLLNKSMCSSHSPQSKGRGMHHHHEAEQSAAFDEATVAQRNGRHVPKPSAHNFFDMSYIENLREEDSATFSAISGCDDVIEQALLLSRENCQTQTGALGNFNSDGKPMVTDKAHFRIIVCHFACILRPE